MRGACPAPYSRPGHHDGRGEHMHGDDMQDRHDDGFRDGLGDDELDQDVHGPDVAGQGPTWQPPPR